MEMTPDNTLRGPRSTSNELERLRELKQQALDLASNHLQALDAFDLSRQVQPLGRTINGRRVVGGFSSSLPSDKDVQEGTVRASLASTAACVRSLLVCPEIKPGQADFSGLVDHLVQRHENGELSTYGLDHMNPFEYTSALAHDSGTNGLLISDGARNVVRGNEIFANGDEDGSDDAGIRVRRQGSTDNVLTNNSVHDNLGDGILMEMGANSKLITDNTMLGNGAALSGTFSAAGRGAPGGPPGSEPLNEWNQNNRCLTQNQEVPPGTCEPDDVPPGEG